MRFSLDCYACFRRRIAGGDLGSLPVILGLVNITLASVPYGIIAIGIVVVLLLGEIDLSVGSVSGLAASVAAVLIVNESQPLFIGLLAGLATGAAIGVLYGLLFTKVGVPSFVITLAGLLSFAGLQFVVLGDKGTINLNRESGLAVFARESFLSHTASYVLVVLITVLYAGTQILGIRRRSQAGLSTQPMSLVGIKAGLMLGGLGFLTLLPEHRPERGLCVLALRRPGCRNGPGPAEDPQSSHTEEERRRASWRTATGSATSISG